MTAPLRQASDRLGGWTPIGFDSASDEPLVWADLQGRRFDQPFFKRTLAAWSLEGGAPTVRTGLDALAALDDRPSREPDLIIAHPSRSGSTLLARLAAAGEATILVSEPAILPQLLSAMPPGDAERPIEPVLRAVVRALGRIRFGDERRYVLKLNSQLSPFLPVIRRAFPQTPMIWLQRRPIEILESNLSHPPGEALPIGEAREAQQLRRLTRALLAATAFVDKGMHILDYRDLPDAAAPLIAALMGLDTGEGWRRMARVARLDSRTGKPFTPRERAVVPERLQAIVRESLDPLYEALRSRQGH